MKVVWDERKRLANLVKHGLDFASVELSIFDTDIVQEASQGRLKAIGYVENDSSLLFSGPSGPKQSA